MVVKFGRIKSDYCIRIFSTEDNSCCVLSVHAENSSKEEVRKIIKEALKKKLKN